MTPLEPPLAAVEAAVAIGAQAECAKSKRGAVVFRVEPVTAERGEQSFTVASICDVVGYGFNSAPDRKCDGSAECASACGEICVHAEERAVRGAVALLAASGYMPSPAAHFTLAGWDLLHAKVVDGQLVPGGGPSCVTCSRTILDAGISNVWLYEQPCPACDRKERKITPPHSSVVGSHAVHSPSGAVCTRSNLPGVRPPQWRCYSAADFHAASLAARKLPAP